MSDKQYYKMDHFRQICRVKDSYDDDFVELLKYVYNQVKWYHSSSVPLDDMYEDESVEDFLQDTYYSWFEDEIKDILYTKPDELKYRVVEQYGRQRALRKYRQLFGQIPDQDEDHYLYAHILIDFSFRQTIWDYNESKELFNN